MWVIDKTCKQNIKVWAGWMKSSQILKMKTLTKEFNRKVFNRLKKMIN